MVPKTIPPVQDFFEEHAGEHLRSIVRYDRDGYEIVFLRDDVAAQYDDQELDNAIDQNRLDSLTSPVYEDVFAKDHGEMRCLVQCFENTLDMNLILDDGIGAIVTLDAAAIADCHGLITKAHDLLDTEHEQ
jgi:hypothetical protein